MSHKFCIAPMIDVTNRHCRFFFRKFSKYARLYTEMVVADSIIYGDKDFLLGFDEVEHPVALQLAGSDPLTLSKAALIGEQYGYDEINLNIGCPSKRVQAGNFGVCLMAHPKLVAECVEKIKEKVKIPVTIKCRIGIDDHNPDEMLTEFVETTKNAGVSTYIIHDRKAMLDDLDPKQNREIPPLDYSRVGALKKRRADLKIIINGGIKSIQEGQNLVEKYSLDGFMIGREAYKNPYILSSVDKIFLNQNEKIKTRYQIAMKMADYIDEFVKNDEGNVHSVIRHILGLYNSLPGAKEWRRELSENARFSKNGDLLRFATDNIEEFIHSKNLILA